jgi:hypothetical protein
VLVNAFAHLHILSIIKIIGSNGGHALQQRKAFMSKALGNAAENQTGGLSHRTGKRRLSMAVASLTAALIVSACGGGGDDTLPGNFNIGVSVGGQFVSQTLVAPGESLDLVIHVGQSVILDAGESVVWTLFVGGSAVNVVNGGAQVFFEGANITATTLDSFSVAVDTDAAFPLQASIPIALVATSTFDSVQVATVDILITN